MLNCLIDVTIIGNIVIYKFWDFKFDLKKIFCSIISQNYAQSNFYVPKLQNKYISYIIYAK